MLSSGRRLSRDQGPSQASQLLLIITVAHQEPSAANQAATIAIPIQVQASALVVVREVGSLILIPKDASTATTGTHRTFQERSGLQKKEWT
jgi:hypothetical protein